MDVRCPQCDSTYELDVSQIPKDSARVKCSSCSHVFRVYKQDESLDATIAVADELPPPMPMPPEPVEVAPDTEPPPPSSPSQSLSQIVVRSENGVLLQIPDQATLQRMIVQRKLSPIDELSYDSETWHRLGTLEDLQPFFQLLMQATPSQISGSGPVMIAGQLDPTSTLEFGLPSSYDPSLFPPSAHASHAPPQGVRHSTARYQEAIMGSSAEYSQPQLPMQQGSSTGLHSASREELPFATGTPPPPAPIFTSSQDALYAQGPPSSNSTAAYGTSLSSQDNLAPPQPEVAYTTLEPLVHEPLTPAGDGANGKSKDQRKIPTLITRSADDWALSPVRLPSHESLSGLPRLPEGQVEHSSRSSMDSVSVERSRPSQTSTSQVSQDDLFSGSYTSATSRSSRWLFLLILVLGLGLGGYSLFNPNVFGTIAYMVRLQEAPPQAMDQVTEIRTQIQKVTPQVFAEANKTLKQLETDLGHPFTEQLATLATLSYLQMDVIRLRYRLMEKKQEYWEKQRQKLAAAKPKATDEEETDDQPDTDDDTAKPKKPSQLEQLQKVLQSWTQQRHVLDARYKKLWEEAVKYVKQSYERNPQHPYTQLAQLHRKSYSINWTDTKQPNAAKKPKTVSFAKLEQQALLRMTDGCHQGWIYLNSASVLIRQGKYKQGLKKVELATQRCNHDQWLYPRFLRVLALTELRQTKKALAELKKIRDEHPEHPLLKEFSNVLEPRDLKFFLELNKQKPKPRKPKVRKPEDRPETRKPESGKPEARKPETRKPEARKPEARKLAKAPKPQPRGTTPPLKRGVRPTPPPRRVAVKPRKRPKKRARRVSRVNLRACGSYRASRSSKRRALRYALQRAKRGANSFILSSLGWCYFDLGQSRKAISWFRKATRRGGYRNDTFYGMGLAFNKIGQRKSACDSLRKQLRRFPRYKDTIEIRALYKDIKCK